MSVVPKCLTFCIVSDSSALKCMRHVGPRIKICLECVKNVELLYIRYSYGMKVLGKN